MCVRKNWKIHIRGKTTLDKQFKSFYSNMEKYVNCIKGCYTLTILFCLHYYLHNKDEYLPKQRSQKKKILNKAHQTVIYKYRKSFVENRNDIDHGIMIRKRSSGFFSYFYSRFPCLFLVRLG